MNRDLCTEQATPSQKFTYISFIIVYKDNTANIDFLKCVGMLLQMVPRWTL